MSELKWSYYCEPWKSLITFTVFTHFCLDTLWHVHINEAQQLHTCKCSWFQSLHEVSTRFPRAIHEIFTISPRGFHEFPRVSTRSPRDLYEISTRFPRGIHEVWWLMRANDCGKMRWPTIFVYTVVQCIVVQCITTAELNISYNAIVRTDVFLSYRMDMVSTSILLTRST